MPCFAKLLALVFCGTAGALWAQTDAPNLPADTLINRIQILGTHNSYAERMDPRVLPLAQPTLDRLSARFAQLPEADTALLKEEHPNGLSLTDGLRYHHPDLGTQLNLGVRSLELDVNPDPKGGLFLLPASYRMLEAQGANDLLPIDRAALAMPGFKVLHMPDFDFRSHCALFRTCLQQIKAWSDTHPGHIPLFLLVEAKVQAIPLFPESTKPVLFDAQRFDELDREILSVFDRSRIVTPDDVRGTYPTLNAAVLAGHWPTLAEAWGKVVFLMLTANGEGGAHAYLDGHPSLRGRVAFLRSSPGEEHAAFLMYDNALIRETDIRKRVAEGYLVRTRSDIETYEAKTNDKRRADAAFRSGAQIVSTDFEQPGNDYGTSYVVRLPGGGTARPDPVRSAASLGR